MKRKWKILLAIGVPLLLAGGVIGGVQYSKRGIVTVQTAKVGKQDLTAVVSASGEIKPRNYINIGADYVGRLTDILVKEGDRVRRGQVVARLESVQAEADVQAQRAAVSTAEAESGASEANVRALDQGIETAQATVNRAKAELQRLQLDFDRAEKLLAEKLIARQDYEQRRAALEAQQAGLVEAQTRVDQARAQRAQAQSQLAAQQRRVGQIRAGLARAANVLQKYSAVAPIDGMVTNLPVRVGETVVPGIQNSLGSTIMTIADMSVITAEVKVDETDIVNVKLDQPAEITIDAIPDKVFHGTVIEIGNTAILRSTGVAASQTQNSGNEAKDFKVVVAISDAPAEIRPGLSCTARITTAQRKDVVTVPIQALTTRTKEDLEAKPGEDAIPGTSPAKGKRQELQGVFVVEGEKAVFREVKTGITGTTDMEVVSGLKEGDQIVTGTYKVIKTMANSSKIKVDNKGPKKES